MTKFKKLMALAAVSMLGIQMLGAGTAFAAVTSQSDCDFGSDNLEVTLGESGNSGADKADIQLYIDDEGILHCETAANGSGSVDEEQAASTIDSITVEMDDDDSDANLWILLDDKNGDAAEWPDFDTFDIDVTTRLVFDGSGVDDSAGNKLRVVVGASTFSFNGTSGTYNASSLEWADGSDDDLFDASKATVRVYVDDMATPDDKGDDVVKGGSGNDKLDLDGTIGDVVVYGNAGNDMIVTGSGDDQGWGGPGSDDIALGSESATGGDVAAPGASDDDVDGAEVVTYADLTGGITWSNSASGDITTGGAAGDDDFGTDGTEDVIVLEGSAGDDVISDSDALLEVYGLGGDDVIRVGNAVAGPPVVGAYVEGGAGNDLIIDKGTTANSPNEFYGNAGNDVLRGKAGDDVLKGGPGSDQTWGGTGEDTCGGEVTNRCELFSRR